MLEHYSGKKSWNCISSNVAETRYQRRAVLITLHDPVMTWSQLQQCYGSLSQKDILVKWYQCVNVLLFS